jgi:mono/diheme cytochrome c family protein
MNLLVLVPVIAVMAVLVWRKANMLLWALAWWGACCYVSMHIFKIPAPMSVIKIYMAFISIGILAFVISDERRWKSFIDPLTSLATEKKYLPLLLIAIIVFPACAAYWIYKDMNQPVEPPSFGRTIHPAPPDEITFKGQRINLVTDHNPYRELEVKEPALFREHVENGRKTYFQNCFYCHGDALDGKGMFTHGLNPLPTNFTDPGTIAMLQETYLFWRIAKGGPGLPEEAGPWMSAMPAWENFLEEDQIWDVILFLYEQSGQKPRAAEGEHG